MTPMGTIVLAAGGATRFGSPKLLAEWWGRPLVEWALRTAPDDGPRIAVVGKETATLRPLFAHYGFAMVRNPRPTRGYARSTFVRELCSRAKAVHCSGCFCRSVWASAASKVRASNG